MSKVPIYLWYGDEIKGIKGEVTEPAYYGWIELRTASLDQSISSIQITKDTDHASSGFWAHVADGRVTDYAVIDLVRPDGGVLLRYEMSQAQVESMQIGGMQIGGAETEVIRIEYKTVKLKYTPGAPVSGSKGRD